MRNRHQLLRRLGDQRGQDAIEYVGVLAVVAVLIGVVMLVMGALQPTLTKDAICLVERIFGSTCSTGAPYPVSASVTNAGYDARVAVVDGSHGYTVTLTKYSDGTSTISAVNMGSLGASLQAGGDFELGQFGSATADAGLGGAGFGQQTTTWRFSSWGQGDKYFREISGDGLSLAIHDMGSATVGSAPIIGGLASKGWDFVFGGQSAPGPGSVPSQYLSSTAVGGGLKGSAEAKAGAELPGVSASVGGSIDAQAGVQRFTSGPEKGHSQLVLGLDGNATGSLESSLFGASADGIGTVNGEVAVSFSPQGKPETLEVAASGDGVWKVGPAEPKLDLPEPPANGGGASSSNNTSSPGTPASGNPTAGSGGAPSSGSPGESAPKPTLSIDSSSSDGSGVGSSFVGTLDLADNPQAEQDVESVLHGDPSKISAVINDLNTSGTETVQTYRIDRSNSSVGAKWSEGVGLGGHITDGTSSATYDPPMTRQDGGPWLSAAH